MATKIEVRQAHLGRVRGLGSAKAGLEHWWAARVTSLALVPLTLWFVISVISLLGVDQAGVAAWVAQPWNAVLLLLLVGMTFQHAQLGLQVVYEDYIRDSLRRTLAILLTKALALGLGLLASLAVLKLALGAH